MSRSAVASTGLILALACWYFLAYVGTGVVPKIVTDGLLGVPKITQMANQWYSAIGGLAVTMITVFLLGWPKRFKSNSSATFAGITFPREYLIFCVSGLCTAVIIPTTTIMYTFHVSVMVAMTIMRGCVVINGRIVDEILIRRGILGKTVSWEENAATVCAIAAVAVSLLKPSKPDELPLWHSTAAVVVLVSYVGAYFVRILIMTWAKNTNALSGGDQKAFFAVEQGFAAFTLVTVGVVLLGIASTDSRVVEIQRASQNYNWLAVAGGAFFGIAAFPSVFLFLLKGRTGTFSSLANRLTSLLAGTTSTLILIPIGGKPPTALDWAAFVLVLIAVGILAKSELKKG